MYNYVFYSLQIELAKQMHPNSCAALKKSDPAVHSTVVCPDRYNTITRLFYPRQNIHPHTKTDTDIGKKVGIVVTVDKYRKQGFSIFVIVVMNAPM